MAIILLVEDEVDLCNLIRSRLEAQGHHVLQAFDGLAALTLVQQEQPQLVILDWMLPGLDGLEVCRRLRQIFIMPIIMLTARTEEVDRVLGLEVGADDYLAKPFSIRELEARVRALLRRVDLDSRAFQPAQAAESIAPAGGVRVHGGLAIDLDDRRVLLDGLELDLTPKEYDLLALLVRHPGRAFSRMYLLQQIWGYDYDGYDRTVDTHITRLRKKLGLLGEKIVTVWSIGYRFIA